MNILIPNFKNPNLLKNKIDNNMFSPAKMATSLGLHCKKCIASLKHLGLWGQLLFGILLFSFAQLIFSFLCQLFCLLFAQKNRN